MYVSDMLQSAKIDLSKALNLITNLVENLQNQSTGQRRHSLNRYGKKLNFYLINVALTRTYRKSNSLAISKYISSESQSKNF